MTTFALDLEKGALKISGVAYVEVVSVVRSSDGRDRCVVRVLNGDGTPMRDDAVLWPGDRVSFDYTLDFEKGDIRKVLGFD